MNNRMKNLLVVDDEEPIVELLVAYFEEEFQNVFRAYSTDEALEVFHREKVDIIISDLEMPAKNGLELLENVREKSPVLPFIFVSGSAAGREKELLKKGAQSVIHKPFDWDVLQEEILRVFSLCAQVANNETQSGGSPS